jgi:anti-sigma factor RsiW
MNRPPRRLDVRASRLMTLSTDPWLSCDDCFRNLDAYVEQAAGDVDPERWEPMRVHLRGCPACAEEAASLVELLASDAELGRRPDLE